MKIFSYLTSRISGVLAMAFLCLFYSNNTAYGAANNLKLIRCHLSEYVDKPSRIRIALDFQVKPERLTLRQPKKTFSEASPGYIEEFLIITQTESSKKLINPVDIRYGSAKGIIHFDIVDHEIHVAVKEEYELVESEFKYIPETAVSYIDLEVVKRSLKSIPELSDNKLSVKIQLPKAEIPDTVVLERKVQDTVYVKEMIRDTTSVKKLVQVEKKESANQLLEISCEHFVHWWSDPHFKLDFKFSKVTVKLVIERSDRKLDGLPEGYSVQYVVYPENGELRIFNADVKVNYIRSNGKIMLKLDQDRCYFLAGDDYTLKPHKFAYDDYARIAYIRVRY